MANYQMHVKLRVENRACLTTEVKRGEKGSKRYRKQGDRENAGMLGCVKPKILAESQLKRKSMNMKIISKYELTCGSKTTFEIMTN